MYDFTYHIDGFWVKFLPNTIKADDLWRQNQIDGVMGCLIIQQKEFLRDLKNHGYRVHKARKFKELSEKQAQARLAELKAI